MTICFIIWERNFVVERDPTVHSFSHITSKTLPARSSKAMTHVHQYIKYKIQSIL